MDFRRDAAGQARPGSLSQVNLPRRRQYTPSPASWRDEILYFLLVDRFSDGLEDGRPLLDRTDLPGSRPAGSGGSWSWDAWARSGQDRFQGGTIEGVRSKLAYLQDLGVTVMWLSPVFHQRGHLDTYHGYGVADFLDVDPRFGTRADLQRLIDEAHQRGMRIILDIIFNHTGHNWNYPGNVEQPPYRPWPDHHDFGSWLDVDGNPVPAIASPEDGVWPTQLQDPARYTRAGTGDLGAGDVNDPHAEHKRTDFLSLRDLANDVPPTLNILSQVYQYWIALTDCDGFRIDTLKHVSLEEARNFCGAVREYAIELGKANFFLVGEVAGGDYFAKTYLNALSRNLNAVLDIGEARVALEGLGKGLQDPQDYFRCFDDIPGDMGSHRNVGDRHVSILNDHDHVSGVKLRFTSDASFDHQVVLPVAVQLFTLGIPCIYYGTEQAFAPPEASVRSLLPEYGTSDRYLREAMFGPLHPRRGGCGGLPPADLDPELPGFGPFGTAGRHCFDPGHPGYRRIAALTTLRATLPVLRHGRQYRRPLIRDGRQVLPGAGGLLAWSRILDVEEALIVANTHGTASSLTSTVLVDGQLNRPGSLLRVVANTAHTADPLGYGGSHPIGSTVEVRTQPDGIASVTVDSLGPSEVLVLTNRPEQEPGSISPAPTV
jgi:glycosidase